MQRDQDFQTAAASHMVKNRDAIRQLAQSGEARRLVSLLQQNGSVESAAQAAAKGRPQELMSMLQNLLATQEGAQLVQNIERQAKQSGLE